MRADAQKNRNQILTVARDAVAEHGAEASMRDIARRAGVGLATLLRHFPTREALFEALLCTHLDALTQKADDLETSASADEALLTWFRELVVFTQSYRSEEHTSELQSLMRISYAVLCLNKKITTI